MKKLKRKLKFRYYLFMSKVCRTNAQAAKSKSEMYAWLTVGLVYLDKAMDVLTK